MSFFFILTLEFYLLTELSQKTKKPEIQNVISYLSNT